MRARDWGGSVLVVAFGYFAARFPHTWQTIMFAVLALGGVALVVWDVIRARAKRATPDVSVASPPPLQHKSLIITPRSFGTFAVMSSNEPNYNGSIEVRVRAYVANQPDSAPATLSLARAAIQLDEYPIDLVETQVGQYAPRGGDIPEGYTYPPVVPTGATLEIECAFWTPTQRDPHGGWFQPQGGAIRGFTLVDLFGVETRLPTDIEFSVSHVEPGWELNR